LDSCHGRCLLKRPELATIVADSLLHFDGQRYRIGDFIVMPNHVHLLAVFRGAEAMKEQYDSCSPHGFSDQPSRRRKGKVLARRAFRSPRTQPGPI